MRRVILAVSRVTETADVLTLAMVAFQVVETDSDVLNVRSDPVSANVSLQMASLTSR